MKGHDIMQMLEHNQRLDCPDKCPQPIYDLMLRCWSWRYVLYMYMVKSQEQGVPHTVAKLANDCNIYEFRCYSLASVAILAAAWDTACC